MLEGDGAVRKSRAKRNSEPSQASEVSAPPSPPSTLSATPAVSSLLPSPHDGQLNRPRAALHLPLPRPLPPRNQLLPYPRLARRRALRPVLVPERPRPVPARAHPRRFRDPDVVTEPDEDGFEWEAFYSVL